MHWSTLTHSVNVNEHTHIYSTAATTWEVFVTLHFGLVYFEPVYSFVCLQQAKHLYDICDYSYLLLLLLSSWAARHGSVDFS